MKKIILLLAVVVGMFGFQSCTGPEGMPGRDGYNGYSAEAEVFEVTTTFSTSNNFSKFVTLNPPILSSDMVLVYRLSGVDQGEDVWKSQPENYYFGDGTLDFGYNFDFTRYDINIYMIGNNLQSVPSQYRLNQVFRIVVIPGYFSNKSTVDFNDYKAVVKAYKIDDSRVKVLN
jgi:hypothetical protein